MMVLAFQRTNTSFTRKVRANPLTPLQAASCTYRIALGPRAGQKVLGLRTALGRDDKATAGLCADAHGFSLHAGVRCGTHQRQALERLCRYITRPAIAISVYVLVAIVRKRLALDASLYETLQILSLTMFETTPRINCLRWHH